MNGQTSKVGVNVSIKKAVVVWGKRNYGKTITLLCFVNQYNVRRNYIRLISQMYRMQQNKDVFVCGSSPSERGVSLQYILQQAGYPCPDLLVVAEQIGGAQEQNTKNFLIQNNYQITNFTIANPPTNNPTHWDYSNAVPNQTILNQRANDIFCAL